MGPGRIDILKDRLTALAGDSPALAKAVAIYRVILPLIEEADLHPSPAAIGGKQAMERLAAGVPLLRRALPSFDAAAAQGLMIRMARCLEQEGVAGALSVREALERGWPGLPAMLGSAVSGEEPFAEPPAHGGHRKTDLLRTLAIHAMKPALRTWCRELSVHNEECRRWESGDCLVCGNPATLGELRGNAQSLYLRCGLCGADWPYPRMRCVFCGNGEAAGLGLLSFDPGIDRKRAVVCERCKGYHKVIVAYAPTPVELLPVEDLATLDLDLAARERGYARPVRAVPVQAVGAGAAF